MALISTTTIRIGGTKIETYKSLVLSQEIDAHHILEIAFPRDIFEALDSDLGLETTRMLAQDISLSIEPAQDATNDYEKLEFNGIVVGVRMVRASNSRDGEEVHVLAKSITYKMEDDPHFNVHEDKKLSAIVKSTIDSFSGVNKAVKPRTDPEINYVVQHNESSFGFLSRLAAQYGEWLYYDGAKIVFGSPGTDELELHYQGDLLEYEINVLPRNGSLTLYASDYQSGDFVKSTSKEALSGTFMRKANDAAKSIFSAESAFLSPGANDNAVKIKLDNATTRHIEAVGVNQVLLRGTSNNPGVVVGKIVKIESEQYRVVSCTHNNNNLGNYINHFQAVYAAGDVYPKANAFAFPRSESTVAKVTENAEDPESLGRIRVATPWMEALGFQSPWLRIVYPHAGSDHGYQFIPEIGDEVLVDFEDGNAESPYVVGSFYNKKATGGHEQPTPKNDVKVLKTRSGHIITLDDTQGSEKISIVDKTGGNSITIDSAKNSITILAADKIALSANDIEINAKNSVTIDAKQNMDLTANQLTGDAKSTMTLKSVTKLDVQSQATGVKGTASVKVEGATAEVNGSGVTIIKGGSVLLN